MIIAILISAFTISYVNLQGDIPFLNSSYTLVIFKQYKISEFSSFSNKLIRYFSKSFNICFTVIFIHIWSVNKIIEHTFPNIHIYTSRVHSLFIWIHIFLFEIYFILDSHLSLIINFWYFSIFMLLGFYLSTSNNF